MPKRIPHTDEVTGIENIEEYLESHKERSLSRYKTFLKELKTLNITGKFLEIGSGPGILAVMIAKENPNVEITALELSPDMITIARRHVEEKGLGDRVRFVEGSVDNEDLIKSLGKFDLIYSTFSMHHWEDPENSIRILYNAVAENGVLAIHDLKRVWWLYYLPIKGRFFESIRASYIPREIKVMFDKLGIKKYKIKTPFPFFWQSILVGK